MTHLLFSCLNVVILEDFCNISPGSPTLASTEHHRENLCFVVFVGIDTSEPLNIFYAVFIAIYQVPVFTISLPLIIDPKKKKLSIISLSLFSVLNLVAVSVTVILVI